MGAHNGMIATVQLRSANGLVADAFENAGVAATME
jgi:hypothetical protein